jgi:hypothetical protein
MMTYDVATQCAHCASPIVDPTTRVIAGDRVYCCPNCAAALEQRGSGSTPQTLTQGGHLRCDHCSAVILTESTMVISGGQTYCCVNCQRAMEQTPTRTMDS